MQRRTRIIIGVVIALAVALSWYVWGDRHTPAGQQSLTRLDASNLRTLFEQFDAATGKTRVLLLLSPT